MLLRILHYPDLQTPRWRRRIKVIASVPIFFGVQ